MTQKHSKLIAALEAIEQRLENIDETSCRLGPSGIYKSIAEVLEIARNALADTGEDLQPSLTMNHCLRCGHDWYPKGPERPRVCPMPRGCGSLSWDKPWTKSSPGPKPRLSR